jgi:hypothetical protein
MVTSYDNVIKNNSIGGTPNRKHCHTAHKWMDDQCIYAWLTGSDVEQKSAGAPLKMGDAVVG